MPSGHSKPSLSLDRSPITLVTLPTKYQSCQRYSSRIFSMGAGAGPRSSTRPPRASRTRFAHCSEKNLSLSGFGPAEEVPDQVPLRRVAELRRTSSSAAANP
jgi:hypothetical protein